MAGEREALARLIAPGAFARASYDLTRKWRRSARTAAARILAAGWRPPPEPQAAEAAVKRLTEALCFARA